jgi:hypothetical protein
MKHSFPNWPSWQIYFAISVCLTRAYRVSVLHHFQPMTNKSYPEKTLVSLPKRQKVDKCLPFHFGQFHQWKWNSTEPWTGGQYKVTLWELHHRLQGVLSRKPNIGILDQGYLFYWRHPTRIVNNKRERWTDRTFLCWKSSINVQEDGSDRVWLARWKECPLISNKCVKFLLVFSTAYLCECGFFFNSLHKE